MSSVKPITKKDVKEIVTKVVIDASHAILDGVQRMFDKQDKKFGGRFDIVESHIERVESELKDEINGLKADIATETVSKKGYNKLKARVNRYHPTN